MHVETGRSHAQTGVGAVSEATEGWRPHPEIIFVFCSTAQPPDDVVAALGERFPKALIAGCTTSGEILEGEHSNGSLVAAGIYESGITWAVSRVDEVSGLDPERADHVVDELFESVGVDRAHLDPTEMVCLLMIDGLSMAEERVSAQLAEALDGVPLAGGSAGDDLKFASTSVLARGGSATNSAVVVLARRGDARIDVLKHQHFLRTPAALCITQADPASRTVIEMDGYPAIEAYARALGLEAEEVTDEISFLNPLTFSCNDELYVRSIQKLNDDGSITFYCGIEEGMVLHVGGHEDMRKSLSADLESLQKADFILGFNCILRALEASGKELHEELGTCLTSSATHSIGFDTYGEQLDGLHINQTLVAVAFRGAAS